MEITAESLVFLVFSAITLGGALLVVTSRNLFHSGLYLMVSLFGVAGLFVLLSSFFLAGVQVVVYIGAIAVLIILAVMLTPQVARLSNIRTPQWPIALAVAVLFFGMLFLVVTPLMDELGADNFSASFAQEHPDPVPANAVSRLGEDLVDPNAYMLPFEAASVLLMAAMIGAVLLVRPEAEAGDD